MTKRKAKRDDDRITEALYNMGYDVHEVVKVELVGSTFIGDEYNVSFDTVESSILKHEVIWLIEKMKKFTPTKTRKCYVICDYNSKYYRKAIMKALLEEKDIETRCKQIGGRDGFKEIVIIETEVMTWAKMRELNSWIDGFRSGYRNA